MFNHPHANAVGWRDVIAAWLVCLAVAATGFAYAEVSAAPDDRVAEFSPTAPQHPPPTVVPGAICVLHKSPVEVPRG